MGLLGRQISETALGGCPRPEASSGVWPAAQMHPTLLRLSSNTGDVSVDGDTYSALVFNCFPFCLYLALKFLLFWISENSSVAKTG